MFHKLYHFCRKHCSMVEKSTNLKLIKKNTKDHSFTTCPNYWLKHIVKKPNSEDRVLCVTISYPIKTT